MFYETVIREAMHIEDLRTLLNGRFLAELWSRLGFPPRVQGAWESRLPDLVSAAMQHARAGTGSGRPPGLYRWRSWTSVASSFLLRVYSGQLGGRAEWSR
ncbi:hypothetical protein SGFS_067850 [Streptomyces graminofaciens]|uniref:Uncharacterized protein n=1 Tax=Streptomyces graminofaciens TaxID=68212 RepID=A0ABM7FHE9_9ACTN|nr:hypothetical protein SGFS_067850 [Streptomyces graminofaciens]